jgi:PPOX class probable F420-dependent enzyme
MTSTALPRPDIRTAPAWTATDPTAEAAGPTATTTELATARFIALTTYRRTGQPVSTPVLFVVDGDRLLVRTAHDAGKLKRIRHTSAVEIAPSDSRGRPDGPSLPGQAVILERDAVGPMLARLHDRYRVAGPLFTAIRRLRGQDDVVIEIRLDRGAAAGSAVATSGTAVAASGSAAAAAGSATGSRGMVATGAVVAGVLTVALVLAGCGGSGAPAGGTDGQAASPMPVPPRRGRSRIERSRGGNPDPTANAGGGRPIRWLPWSPRPTSSRHWVRRRRRSARPRP